MGALVRRWNLMEGLAQRLQQLETQVRQQGAVIEHQQEQLMRQQTTIDAERAARTPANPAQDARVNLVDLRVGNKLETFAGETHEWKSWSFKMRQYIAALDEDLYLELVNVESNPLREMPLACVSEPQKRRARQLAFMLTMHTKDRALQMITKLSDPANGFEIWRRFLEEWEPAHRRRYRAMLMQLLQFLFCWRQRSSLGGVGTTCATVRGTEFRHAPRHDQSSNTGTHPTRSRMAEARWSERDEAARVRCSQK